MIQLISETDDKGDQFENIFMDLKFFEDQFIFVLISSPGLG